MKKVYFELPWPPSVNNMYWSTRDKGRTLSPTARAFRDEVRARVLESPDRRVWFGKDTRVKAILQTHPPDKIKRDTDNVIKATLDALQHAFVMEDDNCVFRIEIERREMVPGGLVKVWLEEVA